MMPRRPMTEEQKRNKRERDTAEQYTSNSSNLVEEITPQILFLDTEPFVISVIFTDALYFKWMFIFIRSGLIVFSFVQE